METDHDRPANEAGLHILATDLDGTFIPLPGESRNRTDLEHLTRQFEDRGITLIFVTGRHFDLTMKAIAESELPQPDWLICDVGTSIFHRQPGGYFLAVDSYQQHQDQIIASLPISDLRQHLHAVSGLRLQESEKQGRFKLSYYADAAQLNDTVDRIQDVLDQVQAPYSIVHSVDPFTGDGLVDLLPADVSKAYALAWWVEHTGLNREAIVFAGDSGNDLAALTAGYRAILVGNADRSLAKRVFQAHQESGWTNHLYLAEGKATSGVLEGCRWFGLIEAECASPVRLGATPVTYDTTHFRVWAPRPDRVAVELTHGDTTVCHELTREENGFCTGNVPAEPDALYRYVLDQVARPDPVSGYQPQGVHGRSQIINHRAFPWTDQSWSGRAKRELIIYELHVGAFTEEGTFRAAIDRLPELCELGITAIEVMPVAQSPGRWNWGYDGVDLFAVRNTYGTPNDFKAFVDACHCCGLAVILDVVYNHIGPEGNYLAEFGPYFSSRHHTRWGEAFNFDDVESQQVRRFIVANALYWLDEYHLDGLRLDAVHCIHDDTTPSILTEIRQVVSAYALSAGRCVHLIAETNVYDRELLGNDEGKHAYDGIWCDCIMHSLYSLALPDLQLTQREYRGASDVAESLRFGYVYEGPPLRRASDIGSEAECDGATSQIESFVVQLQTHDSVGNHPNGQRIHQLTSKAFQKAAAALVLLYPGIPLLFMGEEGAAASPFPFFVDFEDDRLRRAVEQGRSQEYPQHVWGTALSPIEDETFYISTLR